MRIEGVARHMGRKQRIKPSLEIKHEREVAETVGMIVHVAAVKKERTILGLLDKIIPFRHAAFAVFDYFEHPTYFKKSSYS